MATSQFAAPLMVPTFRWFDAAGDPLNGGKVYTYEAGTSTPLATYPTYDDALAGTNANANPVVLDSDGAAQIWLQATFYKVVVKTSADVTLYTQDDVGAALGFPQPFTSEWVKETQAVTYGSGTTFTVADDANYTPRRRVKTVNTGGTVYGTVVSTSSGTVTVVNDSGSLDSGLSAVYYGLLSYNTPSYLNPRTCFSAIKSGNMTGFGSATKVTTWTAQTDTQSEWSAANNRWVAKYRGYYLVAVQVEIADTGTNVAVTPYIYVNNAAVSQSATRSHGTANNITTATVHYTAEFQAGDYVEVFVLGSANTTVQGTSGTRFSVVVVP